MADNEAKELLRTGNRAAWNAWRAAHPGLAPDLRGAELQKLDLYSNDFERGCDLSNCRFDGADLRGSRFVRANLRGASLAKADLTDADLAFALLDGADLTGVRLTGASFQVESMDGAKFAPAAVSCLLCRAEAGVQQSEPWLVLACGACGTYGIATEYLLRILREASPGGWDSFGTTRWTAALDYPEYIRASNRSGAEITIRVCPFCGQSACRAGAEDGSTWRCRVCGPYSLPHDVHWIEGLEARRRQRIMWYLRRSFDLQRLAHESLIAPRIDERRAALVDDEMRDPGEPMACLRFLLEWMRARSQPDGSYLELLWSDYAIARCPNREGFYYVIDQAKALGWIELEPHYSTRFRLTLPGWKQALEWERQEPDRRQVFVAMSFDPSFDQAWRSLAAGIREAGLEPLRVDEVQHNEKICDRLIAEIRRSRVLVADCSRGSGNVYFEAGFALGLGLPVVWTCRRDGVDRLQFDTRQYPYILWERPEDLRERIRDRLQAMLLPTA